MIVGLIAAIQRLRLRSGPHLAAQDIFEHRAATDSSSQPA